MKIPEKGVCGGGSHIWKCLGRNHFGEELKFFDFAWGERTLDDTMEGLNFKIFLGQSNQGGLPSWPTQHIPPLLPPSRNSFHKALCTVDFAYIKERYHATLWNRLLTRWEQYLVHSSKIILPTDKAYKSYIPLVSCFKLSLNETDSVTSTWIDDHIWNFLDDTSWQKTKLNHLKDFIKRLVRFDEILQTYPDIQQIPLVSWSLMDEGFFFLLTFVSQGGDAAHFWHFQNRISAYRKLIIYPQ